MFLLLIETHSKTFSNVAFQIITNLSTVCYNKSANSKLQQNVVKQEYKYSVWTENCDISTVILCATCTNNRISSQNVTHIDNGKNSQQQPSYSQKWKIKTLVHDGSD